MDNQFFPWRTYLRSRFYVYILTELKISFKKPIFLRRMKRPIMTIKRTKIIERGLKMSWLSGLGVLIFGSSSMILYINQFISVALLSFLICMFFVYLLEKRD